MTLPTLQGRFLGRLDGDQQQPIELLLIEASYDEILLQACRLVESTGQPVRVEDPSTTAPILMVEVLPTRPHHCHVADWDGEGWVHRMERRLPMA